MGDFDPDIAKRLIAEAREVDRRMTGGPWIADPCEPPACATVCECTGHPASADFCPACNFVADRVIEERASGIARLRNNARLLADQLEAALGGGEAAAEQDASEVEVEVLVAGEADTMEIRALRAEVQLRAQRCDHPILDIVRQRDQLRAEVAAMRPVVEASVRVVELDEICDAHPSNHDPIGRQAEADLYKAAADRTRAVDIYRARKL